MFPLGGTMRVRKSILASSLVLCAIVASSAQAVGTLGARLGVSISKASLDVKQNFDSANRTGFAGTVFLDLGLGVLDLQPEASYIQKGAKDATTGDVIKLDYVELAALIKAGLPLPTIQPHVFVGLAADYATKNDFTVSNIDFSTKNADWTVPIGVDLKLALGKLALYGDARYAIGLTDVSKGSANVTNLKNRAWILSAGIGTSF
jgi:hypothetical protein